MLSLLALPVPVYKDMIVPHLKGRRWCGRGGALHPRLSPSGRSGQGWASQKPDLGLPPTGVAGTQIPEPSSEGSQAQRHGATGTPTTQQCVMQMLPLPLRCATAHSVGSEPCAVLLCVSSRICHIPVPHSPVPSSQDSICSQDAPWTLGRGEVMISVLQASRRRFLSLKRLTSKMAKNILEHYR